jgi:hypothetical protein
MDPLLFWKFVASFPSRQMRGRYPEVGNHCYFFVLYESSFTFLILFGPVNTITCTDTPYAINLLHVSAFRPTSDINTICIHLQLIRCSSLHWPMFYLGIVFFCCYIHTFNLSSSLHNLTAWNLPLVQPVNMEIQGIFIIHCNRSRKATNMEYMRIHSNVPLIQGYYKRNR